MRWPRWRDRHRAPKGDRLALWGLAFLSYVPLLLTHPGKLGADTKAYLYLDPGRLLRRAAYLWDPNIGLGTVTHQNIGYLFPMGPYYWLAQVLGVPDWIAQRFWMGSIIFFAGWGTRYLLRKVLRWDGRGATVAMLAYALAPFLLHYIYKHSVILLPFSALPWLIAFCARSLRERGWQAPALFALTCLIAGGINATSLLLVLVGPLLWVLHAVFVERELTVRATIVPLLKIGSLTLLTSLWWIAGLMMQGRYGIDILRYTETYKTVANAATTPEIIRGFGYWFFYGTDALGPWFKAAVTETTSPLAIAVSFALPLLGVLGALLTRWRARMFFVAMAITGLVLSVGANPYDDPSPYGALYKAFSETKSGLAMRSTPRAIPLLALATAVFLAAGVAAIDRKVPARGRWAAAAVVLLIIGNLSPLWTGRMLDEFLERPDDVPSYWVDAGRYLDQGDTRTRALEVPGIDFANYRWGSTVDPITPGLTDRQYAARELVPYGSPPSADLMNSLDEPLQDWSFDPSSYSALLRLISAGDLVLRSDLEYERYRTPRPRPTYGWMQRVAGLTDETGFGLPVPNRAKLPAPLLDELELAQPRDAPDPSPVTVWDVEGAEPIARGVTAETPTILAGSGQGIVAAAEAGVLDPSRLTVYSGSVSDDQALLGQLLDDGARLVVTDSNRRAARRWGSTRDNDGFTEMAGQAKKVDPSDNRLELFTKSDGTPRGDDTKTVSVQEGGLVVTASDYGNNFNYTPGDRATMAVDGDPTTAWKVAAFDDPDGQYLQLASQDGPLTTDHVSVLQAQQYVNRWITKLRLTFDPGTARETHTDVTLDASSRSGAGQVLSFPKRTFSKLRMTILDTDRGRLARYQGLSGVGFAEVDLDGRRVTEWVRPPVDLLDAIGSKAADHPLDIVLRRRRQNPGEAGVQTEELRMLRRLSLPQARTMAVSGKARLDSTVADEKVDALMGMPSAEQGGYTYRSSGRLVGDLFSRASKAFDGDDSTAWQSSLPLTTGSWVEASAAAPVTTTFSGLRVLDDGHHSVPTAVHLEVDGVAGPELALHRRGSIDSKTAVVEMATEPVTVTGRTVRVVVDGVRATTSLTWLNQSRFTLPVGIAQVDLGGAFPTPAASPATLATCRSDLLELGGVAVPLRVEGDLAEIERGGLATVASCDPGGVGLAKGDNDLVAADGRTTGIDLDQLLLSSPAAGAASASATTSGETTKAGDSGITVRRTARLAYDVNLTKGAKGGWLLLGQSYNDGWHLTAGGRDLGPPTLVNGFANGWYLDPATLPAGTLHLEWTPQRTVWIALALSGLGLLLCLWFVLRSRPVPLDDRKDERTKPEAVGLFDSYGEPTPWRVAFGVALVSTAVAAALIMPMWWAAVVGVLSLVALRSKKGWPAIRWSVAAMLGLMAAYVVLRQWRNGYVTDFDWPTHFEAVAPLGMTAYVLLGVDTLVEALRAGWRRRTGLDDR